MGSGVLIPATTRINNIDEECQMICIDDVVTSKVTRKMREKIICGVEIAEIQFSIVKS